MAKTKFLYDSFVENGEIQYTVTGIEGDIPTTLEIPEEVYIESSKRYYPVTRIGIEAFKGLTQIEHVSFSKNLKRVLQSAFEDCSSLTSFAMGNITHIYPWAFARCEKLANASLSSLEYIDNYSFFKCASLTKA